MKRLAGITRNTNIQNGMDAISANEKCQLSKFFMGKLFLGKLFLCHSKYKMTALTLIGVAVEFENGNYSTSETSGFVTVCLTRNAEVELSFGVDVVTTEQSAKGELLTVSMGGGGWE